MKIEELIVYGKSFVHSEHAKILLAELLNLNPLELLNYLQEEVSEDIVEIYKKELSALKEGKPLQYVIGNVCFYGSKFIVNENVLIPRFETEELVENTIKYIKKMFDGNIRILDIGCGSGVIGLTLKQKIPNSIVDLVDISKDALEVAKLNAKNLNLDVNFIESDLFSNVEEKYDVIISNPPYIRIDEEIEDIVRENEPHLALYGGVDGLDFYRRILGNVNNHIKDKALIAFEIGYTQRDEIIDIARNNLNNIMIDAKKDMAEKDRMIFILKNNE